MATVRMNGKARENPEARSIIALDKFIQSTRDSGYKSTASAIAELVDNSLQAGASNVDIFIESVTTDRGRELRVAVMDDGVGMDRKTLAQALRFGGSSRYNDRRGMGRFGMGLPNASLSQAKRVTVISWQCADRFAATYLDVDEIAANELTVIPAPRPATLPDWLTPPSAASGTVVIWEKCDRLDNKRISTLERKLHDSLGRGFRYFLWDGKNITVNKSSVKPVDPLFLAADSSIAGANIFQDVITLEVYVDLDAPDAGVDIVEITFTELPVNEWHRLSNDDKRRYGIANGAGVSIIRGSREVDYGWFFMGAKRRENYDDWWRCEIRFPPTLDEAFGITHTKQQIKPKEHILEAVQPIIETTAKALNARVRDAYGRLKAGERTAPAEQLATSRDYALPRLSTAAARDSDLRAIEKLSRRHPSVNCQSNSKGHETVFYKIVEDDLAETGFFQPVYADGGIVAVINPRHSFYKRLYAPLRDGNVSNVDDASRALQLFFLAAARAEASVNDRGERETIENYRRVWSETLDILLRG